MSIAIPHLLKGSPDYPGGLFNRIIPGYYIECSMILLYTSKVKTNFIKEYPTVFQKKRYLLPIFTILLPCLLGTMTMIMKDVPLKIWIQNISVTILLSFLTVYLSKLKIHWNSKWIILASVLLLLLPFLQTGAEGIHRWIRVAGISLNSSMIILPTGIIAIYQLLKGRQNTVAFISILVISLILFFQPDASQLTGFSLAILPCLYKSKMNTPVKVVTGIFLSTLTVLAWIFLDSLPPVNYSEGILIMMGELSFGLYFLGIITLFLIPVGFFARFSKHKCLHISIVLYYWGISLSAFWGNFPVPVIGYGISPIIGYFIVLLWYHTEKENSPSQN